ncbi:MAG: PAS-domain containing protein [Alphaproteobacteria bacterium]|nr:PAS-domain containing protein [Alphaproteobacteria bacterium]MBL6939692.1 PAS-domain containing protein [Alphaproteobacteria bacterium]MBL7096986.1 PAS-domain containing protein [Alphaproteobacteria bacterium]
MVPLLAGLLIAPAPAWAAAGFDSATQELLLTAVTAGALALAIAAALWAMAEQNRAGKLRRALRQSNARTRAAVGERDALLSASREALVVWGRDASAQSSYSNGEAMLQGLLAGPEATEVSQAIDALSDAGLAFAMTAHDKAGRTFTVRGRAVGAMAAVWIEEEAQTAEAPATIDYRGILDSLPMPVWLRDKALSLVWGNQAFLDATNTRDPAAIAQAALDKTERDLAATARTQGGVYEARRFSVVNGHRRALEYTETPLDNAGIVGTAIDVTDVATSEARLQQHIDAHADTLDKLATAVAIFGKDQRLTFYNQAFGRLWDLPEKWLESHPSDSDVLDRLREARKLPEQRDWQAWKRERLSAYDSPLEYPSEDLWHVPGGKTLRVVAQPHPFGGLTYLYEDVTEKLALESAFNTQLKVQSATLDTLTEAVAVFGPDGKLKLHNAAFLHIWELEPKDLLGEPHVRNIAAACAEKFGEEAVWERLIQSIVSGAPQRRDWGEIERNDRTILSLTLSPLPDGATLVTFADVTDRSRIENALRERNDALEAADNLKSDFIKHVSYELRTPLNSILGFAELLASGLPGELNTTQEGYVQDIVSGSNTLKDLINNILDLSLIESGALRLELERIDLCAMLNAVAATARDWAAKVNLEMVVDCDPGAGQFLGDERRIQQVVFNLLSNAIKYTPAEGTITLSGAIEGEDVMISVADTGPGMAPEMKARAFERFASKTRAGQRAGAGLGLALVNRFVELHDGWVEIESEEGTIVRCHFPRRIIPNEPAPTTDRKTA